MPRDCKWCSYRISHTRLRSRETPRDARGSWRAAARTGTNRRSLPGLVAISGSPRGAAAHAGVLSLPEQVGVEKPRPAAGLILICRDLALLGQGAGQAEVGEDAAVGEPGDGADLVAGEGEDDHAVGPGERGVGAGEVAAEGGLGVGPGGHQPQWSAAQGGPVT